MKKKENINHGILKNLISECKEKLQKDKCYPPVIRDKFKEYNYVENDQLYNTVCDIYNILLVKNDSETFYAQYFNKVVSEADIYFNNLEDPHF